MVSFWLDRDQPPTRPALDGEVQADVAIIGGGFTGLWTAIELLEREPTMSVVVCEADVVGYGASGRNGGFLDTSLTHGLLNGLRHFPKEIDRLESLAEENYARMRAAFDDYGMAVDFDPVGTTDVATKPHQIAELAEWAELENKYGHLAEFLDRDQACDRLNSPIVLAGVRRPDSGGVLDPAKLSRGLAAAAESLGATIAEHSKVTSVGRVGDRVAVTTPSGRVTAPHVVLATNAYSGSVLRRTRRHFVPVYDYIVMTEPLTDEQYAAIGWKGREGISDAGNQFHYFRLTADNRILWGGYDAVYYPGGKVGPQHDDRAATYQTLERNFRAMFPQLREVEFAARWGGAIATTTRFTPMFGEALGGRVIYALGYTGLGVATSCFAARVLADKLLAPASELLGLDYVRKLPFPFPPEPLRTVAVSITRRAIANADDHEGRRGLWLAMLDRFGIGFDS
jgi:glycine/D-amino acid oxidase-like deaminating enzyme